MLKKFLLVLAAGVIAGCASLDIKTPRQGVAACYSAVTATFNTGTAMRERGALTDGQKEQVLAAVDKAAASCDLARAALAAGDVTKADGALRAAEAVLIAIEASMKGAK